MAAEAASRDLDCCGAHTSLAARAAEPSVESTMTAVRASVVIATRDRPEELEACLRSVRRACGDHDEIIVVDSASVDGDGVRKVAGAFGARFYRSEVVGSAHARNVGIRNARGSIV